MNKLSTKVVNHGIAFGCLWSVATFGLTLFLATFLRAIGLAIAVFPIGFLVGVNWKARSLKRKLSRPPDHFSWTANEDIEPGDAAWKRNV